jgi:hypothetical protein
MPKFCNCGIERLLAAAGDGDTSALCHEEPRGGQSNAAVAACDQCRLVFEPYTGLDA